MDYDDSKKDDQGWTDGFGEEILLADALDNTSKSPDEPIPTATETSDQIAEGANKETPINDEPSSSTNARTSTMRNPTGVNE